MTCGIYAIRCRGSTYIGSSVNVEKRWRQHLLKLEKGKHANSHLQRIYTKHGGEALTFEMVELCPEDQLRVREQWYLDHWQPKLNAKNQGACGLTSAKMKELWKDPEIAAKMAAGNRGRRDSVETRAKKSEAHKGRRLTPEQRMRLREVNLGRPCSPETRKKIGEAQRKHQEKKRRGSV